MIIATNGHEVSQNVDVNYFTDADLSILGAPPAEYEQYTKDVRKEYSIYPDILYKPGRKKVLKHFMEMPTLFKTEFFRNRLESQARSNIAWEMEALS
jgi:predicted metal-dependent HD superfamily phosphohydrolase